MGESHGDRKDVQAGIEAQIKYATSIPIFLDDLYLLITTNLYNFS